jgi:hypothetical protein
MLWPTYPSRTAVGLALCLTCALSATARGVVVSSIFEDPTLLAPGNDPGWNNVARLSNASAVYLGNRWVLTANHVTDGPVRFTDGRVFNVSVGSKVGIKNAGGQLGSATADLRMFRLADDPGLPALEIAASSPEAGTVVTMIGAGFDRAPELIGWNVNGLNQWSEVLLTRANRNGFKLLDASHMRWGVNQALGGTSFVPSSNTFVFSTRFDKPGIPFEAQAVAGDSGGGVFEFVDGGWKLAGIMITVQTLASQPAWTTVFGQSTNAADLSMYRDQILDLVNKPEPLWQNQVNHFDVNGSGRVNAHDALFIISELQERSFAQLDLPATRGASDPFYDVDGDLRISAQDVSRLISALLSKTANPAAAAGLNATFVAEPSSAALALWALLPLVVALRRLTRRKPRG